MNRHLGGRAHFQQTILRHLGVFQVFGWRTIEQYDRPQRRIGAHRRTLTHHLGQLALERAPGVLHGGRAAVDQNHPAIAHQCQDPFVQHAAERPSIRPVPARPRKTARVPGRFESAVAARDDLKPRLSSPTASKVRRSQILALVAEVDIDFRRVGDRNALLLRRDARVRLHRTQEQADNDGWKDQYGRQTHHGKVLRWVTNAAEPQCGKSGEVR